MATHNGQTAAGFPVPEVYARGVIGTFSGMEVIPENDPYRCSSGSCRSDSISANHPKMGEEADPYRSSSSSEESSASTVGGKTGRTKQSNQTTENGAHQNIKFDRGARGAIKRMRGEYDNPGFRSDTGTPESPLTTGVEQPESPSRCSSDPSSESWRSPICNSIESNPEAATGQTERLSPMLEEAEDQVDNNVRERSRSSSPEVILGDDGNRILYRNTTDGRRPIAFPPSTEPATRSRLQISRRSKIVIFLAIVVVVASTVILYLYGSATDRTNYGCPDIITASLLQPLFFQCLLEPAKSEIIHTLRLTSTFPPFDAHVAKLGPDKVNAGPWKVQLDRQNGSVNIEHGNPNCDVEGAYTLTFVASRDTIYNYTSTIELEDVEFKPSVVIDSFAHLGNHDPTQYKVKSAGKLACNKMDVSMKGMSGRSEVEIRQSEKSCNVKSDSTGGDFSCMAKIPSIVLKSLSGIAIRVGGEDGKVQEEQVHVDETYDPCPNKVYLKPGFHASFRCGIENTGSKHIKIRSLEVNGTSTDLATYDSQSDTVSHTDASTDVKLTVTSEDDLIDLVLEVACRSRHDRKGFFVVMGQHTHFVSVIKTDTGVRPTVKMSKTPSVGDLITITCQVPTEETCGNCSLILYHNGQEKSTSHTILGRNTVLEYSVVASQSMNGTTLICRYSNTDCLLAESDSYYVKLKTAAVNTPSLSISNGVIEKKVYDITCSIVTADDRSGQLELLSNGKLLNESKDVINSTKTNTIMLILSRVAEMESHGAEITCRYIPTVGPVTDSNVQIIRVIPADVCDGIDARCNRKHPYYPRKFIACGEDRIEEMTCPDSLIFELENCHGSCH